VLALSAFAPAGAGAQDVIVDPSSPTGREYAIPLDQARRDAGGTTAQPARSPRRSSRSSGSNSGANTSGGGAEVASDPDPSRFGRGITAAPRRARAPRRRPAAARRPVAPPVVASRGVTDVKPADSGLDSGLLLALGIVGLGASLGLAARLLRRRASPG
jgi:hypothetical protein